MSGKGDVTRFTTPDERSNTKNVELEAVDVGYFTELLRKGLIQAAAEHVAAVQDNFALRAEMSIRLSRPVRNEKGEIVELVGREVLEGTIRARKIYIDPDKAPKD